jgi:hypothetical protein
MAHPLDDDVDELEAFDVGHEFADGLTGSCSGVPSSTQCGRRGG